MIWLTLRDLRWRARRVVLGVLATASVLAMTLLLGAVHDAFLAETTRTVAFFGADTWVVPTGVAGPFTTNSPVPTDPAPEGGTPVAIFRHVVVRDGGPTDVNVIAYRPGGVVVVEPVEGRAPRGPGEVAVDRTLGAGLGERLTLGGERLLVVGVLRGLTYNGGTPAVVVTLDQGQRIAFDGRDLAGAFVVRGTPAAVPPGLTTMTPTQVRDDMRRPLEVATRTLALLSALLWLVAAGIVGFVCYVAGLDRQRDVAVLKSVGVPTWRLVGGVALEGVLLAGTAAVLAVVAALVLVPLFPLPVAVTAGQCLTALGVGVVIGLVAAAASVRQVLTTDPALAFAST
ncbi:FtsX-like permease family protein [Cellulomonas sp. P5_C6]